MECCIDTFRNYLDTEVALKFNFLSIYETYLLRPACPFNTKLIRRESYYCLVRKTDGHFIDSSLVSPGVVFLIYLIKKTSSLRKTLKGIEPTIEDLTQHLLLKYS